MISHSVELKDQTSNAFQRSAKIDFNILTVTKLNLYTKRIAP